MAFLEECEKCHILGYLIMSTHPRICFCSLQGLSPSVGAMTRAETMTASTPPGEALFIIRPSAWKEWHWYFWTGYVVDEDHAQGNEIVKDKKLDSTQVINALSSNKPTLFKMMWNFWILFSLLTSQTFIMLRLFSRKINDSTLITNRIFRPFRHPPV